MSCWPPCSVWCECIDNQCQPTRTVINAVRFRTPDGRYLQAANGGGGLMLAVVVDPPPPASPLPPRPSESFLFVPPTAWPLSSGSAISLDVASGGWAGSGFLVRVDHTTFVLPPKKKSDRLVGYEIGGPGTQVFVSGPFPQGFPAYRGNDPAEWTFTLLKIVGGVEVPSGTAIGSGDQVSIRINSNRGKTFYFRVTAPADGAEVHGDGETPGQDGTVFTAEFGEVRPGLGWRPTDGACRSCAVVTVQVTGAANGSPVRDADVTAAVPDHPFFGRTGTDGRVVLTDGDGHDCIPDGSVEFKAAADRYRTKAVTVPVPAAGALTVPIALDCTQVMGKVVDSAGNAVPGVTVYLRDDSQPRKILRDANGAPFRTATAADGSFVFNCVQHGYVQVWTTADPSQE